MKVFNLTDIETPILKSRGLVGVPIAVGSTLIAPGGEAEVGDTEMIRRDIVCFTAPGALSVGVRPPAYLVAQSERASRARLAEMEQAARKRKEK